MGGDAGGADRMLSSCEVYDPRENVPCLANRCRRALYFNKGLPNLIGLVYIQKLTMGEFSYGSVLGCC